MRILLWLPTENSCKISAEISRKCDRDTFYRCNTETCILLVGNVKKAKQNKKPLIAYKKKIFRSIFAFSETMHWERLMKYIYYIYIFD